MNYFKQIDNKIEKYSVKLDIEELKNLRKEIIDNCSNIVHKDYESKYAPCNVGPGYEVRNYKENETDKYEYGLDEISMRVYHYTYDEYRYPTLINMIDDLLNGNMSSIERIFDVKYSKSDNHIYEMIKKVSSELNMIDELNTEEKRQKLSELEKLIYEAKTFEKQTDKYYKKTQNLITLTYIDSIYIEEVKKVETFFDDDIEKNYQEYKTKVKK